MLAVPEPWFEGYRETRSRSGHYPAVGARNDNIYRTSVNEDVRVTVTRCGPTGLLEGTPGGQDRLAQRGLFVATSFRPTLGGRATGRFASD